MAAPRGLVQFLRHQLVSIVTTVVDYSVMIVLVSVLGMHPDPATACGAAAGAVTNFFLGRHFTFKVSAHAAHRQMLRYAVVSGCSLALNTGGEHLFSQVLGLQYIVARVITSIIVSVGWNFPMQKYVVFAPPRSSSPTEAQ